MAVPTRTVANVVLSFTETDGVPDTNPHVLALANGQFDIAHVRQLSGTDHDAWVQRLNADGSAFSSGFATRPNGPVDDREYDPSLVSLGNLQAMAFSDRDQAQGTNAIRVAYYNGTAISNNGLATSFVTVDDAATLKTDPEIALMPDGRMVVVWVDLTAQQVRGRFVDPVLGPMGSTFTISTTPTRQFGEGAYDLGLTVLSTGNFAVSWVSNTGVIRLRVVDGPGTPVSGDIAVAAGGVTDVVELADGRIAIVYGTLNGIAMETLAPDGSSQSAAFQVTSSPLDDSPAAVTLLDGRLFVVWVNVLNGDVRGRIMNPDGTPASDVFDVAATSDNESRPHLALLADGRVAVSWENATDGTIEACIYDPRETGVTVAGTSGADQYVGSAFADIFVLGDGGDSVDGGDGSDYIDGGNGNDVVNGGDGHDTLFGGSGNDTLNGGDGFDTLSGGDGNDILNGEGGDDFFALDGGNDTITGGAGLDWILAVDRDFLPVATPVVIDLAGRVVVSAVYGTDTLTDLIENATGGSGNDIFAGNALVNVLDGGAGVDTISYYMVAGNVIIDLAGNTGVDGTSVDTLLNFENANGGHGNDQLSGRQGIANRLDGLDNGAGGDTVSYYLDNVSVNINLGTSSSVQNGVVDTLLNFENANGSRVGDSITGTSGNNVINGLGGADLLTGNGGNDTFVFNRQQAAGDSITDFLGNGAGVGDTLRFTGYGTAAQGSTFTFVSGNTWQIHSGLHGTNELITINGGSGAVHATDYVFA